MVIIWRRRVTEGTSWCKMFHVAGSAQPINCSILNWTIEETYIVVESSDKFDTITVAGTNYSQHGGTFNITNLSPGCTYNITFLKQTYTVCNISLHTKLQSVSNVKAHAVNTTTLSVSWTAPQGCYDGFNIRINPSTLTSVGNVTSYIMNDLKPGVTYRIEIITFRGENASNPSASQNGTTNGLMGVIRFVLADKGEKVIAEVIGDDPR
ncbi:tenascin-R-like [Protopterus annectens]|uniref:tenascin-R-like n=1 Tax=Protopterus annectens TaxID=7888 RepID=UPI001CF9B79D|nr:tenascin-R-like [Protopterus annectens]